jgi:hypothetical protein
MTSIAFPTIGCGNLHYPPEKVAQCFKSAVKPNTSLRVYLTVYDTDQTYKTFKDLCKAPGCSRSSSSATLQKFSPHKAPSPVTAPGIQHPSVIFNIYAPDHVTASSVKDQLDRKLDTFVYKTSMKFANDLTESQVQRLRSLASADVDINIDAQRKMIKFSGFRDEVEKKHRDADRLLSHFMKTSTDLTYIEQARGHKAYLQAFCSQPEVIAPKHWRHYRGNLNDVVAPHGKLASVDQELFKAVVSLVMKTWDSSKVGGGQDAMNLSHHGIVVKNVQQIENVTLYKSYITHLKESYKHSAVSRVLPIKGLYGEKEIETISQGDPELQKLLIIPELNECFLFHGTSRRDAIIKQGIDYRLGSHGALFGQGCYFAESSTKADQYADPKDARVGLHKPLYMFIFRVLLGSAHVCQKPRQFKRPPCTDNACCSDTCSQHTLYDSVIGTHNYQDGNVLRHHMMVGKISQTMATRRLLFREFVIYEQPKCYPEFLIEYERC